MDSQRADRQPDNGTDLSALAWVQDELRRCLEAAHKALRRFVKDAAMLATSDVDSVDPMVLRTARQQIHQGVGALELIGLPAASQVLQASESLVQRAISRPNTLQGPGVTAIERASFAVLDYLSRMLAGKEVSALFLFPHYQAVLELARAERVHPSELWAYDWRWLELPPDSTACAIQPDADTHRAMEQQLLSMMRADTGAKFVASGKRMSQLCAGLGSGTAQAQTAVLWALAAAVYEAQAQGLLQPDVFVKRLGSQLLAQLRRLERGEPNVSPRLARDLLFFCAQAALPLTDRDAPRLAAVRQAYGLRESVPADYTANVLGRFDPAVVAQARKRVVSAKDAWAAVDGGEMQRLTGLAEQFSLVSESLIRLYPSGEVLAQALQATVAQTQHSSVAPQPPLAMEVATSLLYLDASLENADFDDPQQAARVQRLADRINAVRGGSPPQPLEAWMEELYRSVSDKQTLGSVVQELRSALSESEKLIDQFFRNPSNRQVLIPVPAQLSAMRGVLSVLGLGHATHAVLRMRDDVDGLISTEVDPEQASRTGTFDRLAGNLGALGFLIDMFSVQPHMAKSLFAYDSDAGTLRPVMGRTTAPVKYGDGSATPVVAPHLIEHAQALGQNAVSDEISVDDVAQDLTQLLHEAQIADQPLLVDAVSTAQAAFDAASDEADVSSAREKLSEAMVEFVASVSEPASLGLPVLPTPSETAALAQVGKLDDDAEMREVFLEEALEVLTEADIALKALAQSPSDVEQLTVLRRAFHTLKGSSRMVGLTDFGNAAWICEQIYNSHLAEQRSAEPQLLEFSARALKDLSRGVEAVSNKQPLDPELASTLQVQADALTIPPPVEPDPAAEPNFPLNFPVRSDLELSLNLSGAGEPSTTVTDQPAGAEPGLNFQLDLSLPTLADEPGELTQLGTTPQDHRDQAALSSDLLDASPKAPDTSAMLSQTPAETSAQEPFHTTSADPTSDSDDLPSGEIDLAALGGESPTESAALIDENAGAAEPGANDEQTRVIGSLRISIPLFNIYLNEADELSRRLCTKLAEWAMELDRPVGETTVALAHSLAGSSATVGFEDLSLIARALEHALMRSQELGHGSADEADLFINTGDEIRRLLHQFAAGFLKTPSAELLARLTQLEADAGARARQEAGQADEQITVATRTLPEYDLSDTADRERVVDIDLQASSGAQGVAAHTALETQAISEAPLSGFGMTDIKPLADLPIEPDRSLPAHDQATFATDGIDAVDAIDAELFPIFEEECQELLPHLGARLRDWTRQPNDSEAPAGAMRTLHTLKGGARLAGAMRLGELCHHLEGRIEHLLAHPPVQTTDLEDLLGHSDTLTAVFDALRSNDVPEYSQAATPGLAVEPGTVAPAALLSETPIDRVIPITSSTDAKEIISDEPAPPTVSARGPASTAEITTPFDILGIDWSRFPATIGPSTTAERVSTPVSQAAVRVRAPLLDGLINQAGEVSITRTRIEAEVSLMKASLTDLTDNLERLRGQLRELELQGETQMSSRMEATKGADQSFDPLEFDRFTRFQELTRMLAESVNDVATVQRTLQRSLEGTEDELVAQTRLMRDLSADLLRTRMVEFEGYAERLYRVVRLTAKETGKQVRLDIVGGSIELDRGVLERMIGSFEHLLRNCVTHGIETPEARVAAGKDPVGSVIISLQHEGNEVAVEFRDDGSGLDLAAIRDKGVAAGLLDADAHPSEVELANLIFKPGFSTAKSVTELAGRGVGMDVVLFEVNAVGGRIETATAASKGTSFKLVLPLTTAVTQVVMLRTDDQSVAVPSTLVEVVRRVTSDEIESAYRSATFQIGERSLPFFWLGALLQISPRSLERGRSGSVVVIRSAQQRMVLHVDEVLGKQEVVVKNLGPQLSRLPGLVGVTLLASGSVALIYNPVALATLYGDIARETARAALTQPAPLDAPETVRESKAAVAPLVLVVDDSLTVRRVTQRLLAREGYRVALAKDGMDALERLAEEKPQVVLSDIEMPRMDGFDLVRNIRGDSRLKDLPVIMITSRIAEKHREHAAKLGVDHYLGKPYSEEDLLSLIGRFTSHEVKVLH